MGFAVERGRRDTERVQESPSYLGDDSADWESNVNRSWLWNHQLDQDSDVDREPVRINLEGMIPQKAIYNINLKTSSQFRMPE